MGNTITSTIPEVPTFTHYDEFNLEFTIEFFGAKCCTEVPKCANVVKDVVFIVEASPEVGQENYENALNFIEHFSAAIGVQRTTVRTATLVYNSAVVNNTGFARTAGSIVRGHEEDLILTDGLQSGQNVNAAVEAALAITERARPFTVKEIILIGQGSTTNDAIVLPPYSRILNLGVNGYSDSRADSNFDTSWERLGLSPTENMYRNAIGELGAEICSSVLPSCTGKLIDLCNVLDGSGSVGRLNFYRNKQWLKDLMRDLQVGPDSIHMSLVQFSSEDTQIEEFGFLSSQVEITNAVD